MSTKRKVRAGQIEIDPEEFALVVHYSYEVTHLDDGGNPFRSEVVPGKKVVRVSKNVTMGEIPALAQEVVEKCKYIHSSKVNDVEQLLYRLKEQQAPNNMTRQPALPQANIANLEEYADMLYEDNMEIKVQGVRSILALCMQPQYLEFLAEHECVLNVLSRELREQAKKSQELSVAIVCCFLCFSHFSQFHPTLIQNQCGDVTMRTLEYESKRYLIRRQEMEKNRRRCELLGAEATDEDRRSLQKEEVKFRKMLNRQNRLLHVCTLTLLNLAEDISIEKKMVNRRMPQYLVQFLDRTHEDLLLVTLTFLKKLAIFEENKEQMVQAGMLDRLVVSAQHPNAYVALLALRLLYNVSFDERVRASLVETGLVKQLVDLLRNPPFRQIVLRLLYHFTMEDRCKSILTYSQDCMVMLLQLVVHFPEARVGKDLVALAVNLGTHARAAELMVQSPLFPQVMLRLIKTRDPLLCKVMRHVASHDGVREQMYELLQSDSVRMSKWMHEFVRMAQSCIDNPDLLVEVLGTLANMTNPEVPWPELCETGLIDLLHRLLVVGFSEDDLVLECVMLVGVMALNKEAAPMLAVSKLLVVMQELLAEKQEDDEIVLQLLFSFHCLLAHEETREIVMQDTQVTSYVMDLMRDKNESIRKQATATLSLIAEFDAEQAPQRGESPTWAERIKALRFELHNQEWCAEIRREEQMGGGAPVSSFDYFNNEDQHGGDEEDFVFHWDDAGEDLADRYWGNYLNNNEGIYHGESLE